MQKKPWVFIGVGILLIALAVWWGRARKDDSAVTGSQTQNQQTQQPQQQAQQATTTPPPPATAKKTTSGSSSNIAYSDAVQQYGSTGYRIQFVLCRGTPGQLSIKQGAKFMIDNRDSSPRTVVVKSQTFKLPAYGFAIVTAKELGTYNITCDGGGAAELNVEK